MVIARAGSAMAAEIGIMRISEQIDALETMDIDPMRYLISPRIAAALICFPLLTALFDVVGLYGGYLSGSVLLGVNPAFLLRARAVERGDADIVGGFLKSLVFRRDRGGDLLFSRLLHPHPRRVRRQGG